MKTGLFSCRFLFTIVFIISLSGIARADYTISSGSTVDASTLTGQSGTLTIDGTLKVTSNVSLTNFTTVIINGPNGQIFWQNNSDLTFSSTVSITLLNNALGLQPTGGNASKRLIIGTVTIAVSNDNSNNAAFSFAEFNAAGGLPQFILSTSTTSVCLGSSFTATITPLNNTVNYDCSWTISPASGSVSPASHSNFNSAKSTTITPTAANSYTVSCKIYKTGDTDPITTKTKTVTVNALPTVPTAVSATPTSICSGASSNIKGTSAGNTIEWYTVSSGGTAAGSSSSGANYSVTPASTTTYYAGAYNSTTGCRSSSRTSVTVTVTSNTWLGNSSNWDDVNNWCSGTIPSSSTNVQINNGVSFYPVITGTAYTNNITIATGGNAIVTVNGGTLKVNGTISSTNDITATAGTIEMTGSSAQSVRADNFSSATIANLKINNSLAGASAASPSVAITAAGGMLKVSGSVSFGNLNNAVLHTNDYLTLLSSASATANIADLTNSDVNSGNTIYGKVVVERYIPGRRAWRLLTAPVTTASNVTIKSAWQDGAPSVTDVNNINSTNNPSPGYGTHICYGKPASNGYDQGVNGNSSIFYLTGTGWNGIPSSTSSVYVTSQPAFLLFVRGDRSTQLAQGVGASISSTVLRPAGNINQGLLNMPLGSIYSSGGSSFRLISNPYASAINYHKIATATANSSASIPDAFYLWDPNITGTNGVGGWVGLSYNSSTLSYDRTVGSSTINNSGDIQSGTAFLIDYNGSASALQIKESSKVNTTNNTQFRPLGKGKTSQLRVSLLAQNADGTTSVNDGVLSTFDDSYNDAVDERDLKKMGNFTENISLENSGRLLAIERRGNIRNTDIISYNLKGLKKKNYQLLIEPSDLVLPAGTNTMLKDKFLDSGMILDVNASYKYDFSVTADAGSADTNRFSLVFVPSVVYSNISVTKPNDDIDVKWTATGQENIKKYVIERSTDGISYTDAGEQIKSEGTGEHSYTWKDIDPLPGKYYYRIRSVADLTDELYSEAASITVLPKKDISVFPNPVTTNTINVQLGKASAGTYTVRLFNNNGSLVYSKGFSAINGNNTFTFTPGVSLATGSYRLEIKGPGKKMYNTQVHVINK